MTYTPEFSRPVAIEGLTPDQTRTDTFTVGEAECAALAARFGLRRLYDFTGKVCLTRVTAGEYIRVTGEFSAKVVQACVVSLQDVPGHVEGEFETYFSEDGKEFDPSDDLGLELEAEDENLHSVFANGAIDMGELVAQYLSLELDPYPRAEGIDLGATLAEAGLSEKSNPFHVLKAMKEDKGE